MDGAGRVLARVRTAPAGHLMDFEVDDRRELAYVSLCGRRQAVERIDLDRRTRERRRVGACGLPLAVHEDRLLVLAAHRLNDDGEPAGFVGRPQRLRLVDLRRPRPAVTVPRRGAPLDAVVVE